VPVILRKVSWIEVSGLEPHPTSSAWRRADMLCQNERVYEKPSYYERDSGPGAACTLACLSASPSLGSMSASVRMWREFLQFLSE